MKVIPCDASLPVVLGSFLWCWCRDAGAAFICVGSVLGLHRISALKKYSITSFRTRRTHLLPETVIGTYSRGVQRQPFHHVYRVFPQEHYTLQSVIMGTEVIQWWYPQPTLGLSHRINITVLATRW